MKLKPLGHVKNKIKQRQWQTVLYKILKFLVKRYPICFPLLPQVKPNSLSPHKNHTLSSVNQICMNLKEKDRSFLSIKKCWQNT